MEKKAGLIPNEPVAIWKEKNVLVDGHTRVKAAKEAGITDIPFIHLTFADEDSAVEWAIQHNAIRRAVTTGDKFRLVQVVDERGEHGGDKKTNRKDLLLIEEASRARTAKLVGWSDLQISKCRAIIDYCDDDTIIAVEDEDMSVDTAWKIAKATKEKIEEDQKNAGKFNEVNENIDWAKWSWNPVTGCLHGCKYCYARDIANRFYKEYKFEPHFYPERIEAPNNTKIPKGREDEEGIRNVFLVSMGDLLGKWVPDEWIEKVLTAVTDSPQWNYLLLTKNPKRYLEWEWPDNIHLGITTGITAGRCSGFCILYTRRHSRRYTRRSRSYGSNVFLRIFRVGGLGGEHSDGLCFLVLIQPSMKFIVAQLTKQGIQHNLPHHNHSQAFIQQKILQGLWVQPVHATRNGAFNLTVVLTGDHQFWFDKWYSSITATQICMTRWWKS